jgi:hypothetical protein
MSEPTDPQVRRDPLPAPELPDVESPPRDDVLERAPSKEEVVEQAPSADEVIAAQPSVDEILGRDS